MPTSIIILAAGAGSRMKSDIPKVLHKICGKEMLFYSIKESLKLSDDIHVVLFHQAEKIIDFIQKNFPKQNIHIHIQNHSKFPGTGGALMKGDLKDLIDTKYNKILVLNGDMPLIKSTQLQNLISLDSLITISVCEIDNPYGYGRVIIQEGKINQIVEEKDACEAIKSIKTINAGVYVFNKEILKKYLPKLKNQNSQKEYYLTDVIALAQKDSIEISPAFFEIKNFIGVNSKSDLAQAEMSLINDLITQAMQKGVIFHLPHTIYIESEVEFEGECEIEQGVCIKGNAKISNSHIKAHSIIEDSVIIDSDIGPLAHIRPNCEIYKSHIGNFVEVKKSKLNGVKAGHLSYLGDALIDEGTNVGAGVITCNYDGKKKHSTIIGKNVFIGSDTQLIAPITIQSNVLIASGTTMTKNAKEGDLVLSRVKQENKNNGFYKFFTKSKG